MPKKERLYSVQLCFWTLSVLDTQIMASSVEDACERAGKEANWDGQRTIYDSCTTTKVADIARGDHSCAVDAPAGAKCRVPEQYRDPILTDNDEVLQRARLMAESLMVIKQGIENAMKSGTVYGSHKLIRDICARALGTLTL